MEIEQAAESLYKAFSLIGQTDTAAIGTVRGRIIAEDIASPINVPSFPKAAMDGYAVSSEDIRAASSQTPVTLKVIGCLFAGDRIPDSIKSEDLRSGCAVRIMTGAQVPAGFDTVIKQEDTDYGEEEVRIFKSQTPYVNYCKVGEDVREGALIASKGDLLDRSRISVLASTGVSKVSVYRKLDISVISTGSEIVDAGSPLGESQIYNNIAYMLQAALDKPAFNCSITTVADDEELIAKSIVSAACDSDIVITTGGVSVGKKDHLPEVLKDIGAQILFDHVNIKPGSLTIGAVYKDKPLLCLSGNPYAATASFDMYFGHIVRSLTSCTGYIPVSGTAVLESDFNKPSNVRRLVRANSSSGKVTIIKGNQMSSVMSAFIGADCYVDFPKGSHISKGDTVNIMRIPEALL